MVSELHPYPAYKPTVVPWLGGVPEHWEVRRLGSIAGLINGATPSTSVSEYWDGHILWVTPDDLGKLTNRYIGDSARRITESGYKACATTIAPASSIAISTRAPIGHIGILQSEGCVNQGCRLLVPGSSIQPEYLHYTLSNSRSSLASLGQGSTFTELSRTLLAAFCFPLPPIPEQRAIVRYLDHVDRRIRRYVAAKRKLIALLEEEKQAVVNQAVTRGLDPNIRLKPSGVEWLGDVPEHWETMRARFLFREIDTRSTSGRETHLSMSQTLGLVPSNLVEQSLISDSYVGGKLCQEGDLVLNRLKAHLGVFAVAKQVGVISPDYSVFRNRGSVHMGYFFRVLRLPALRAELRTRAKGIVEGFWRLYTDDFFDIRLPVPPPVEQQAIVKYIEEATGSIDNSIARARRQIELVNEYRTRLIADVVTGKLDVREAAAQLPKQGEAEPMDGNGGILDYTDGGAFDEDMPAEGETAMESEVTA